MTTPVTPELRSQIITSIKEGMTIAQAAETHGLTARTIAKWMRRANGHSHASPTEVQKLKKDIEFLKSVILDLILEKKAAMRKG